MVVGAGPSGAMAALHLAAPGCAVLLLDEKPFPREKVCGDALLGDALACLERAGLLEDVRARAFAPPGVRIFSPARHQVALSGPLLTLRREALDHLLAAGAVARGAVFGHGRVLNVTPAGSSGVAVYLEGVQDPLKARVAVLATGADVALAGSLGLVERRTPTAVAARKYVRSRYETRELTISYDRTILPGYAWIFPVGPGEYNVGCGQVLDGEAAPNLKTMFEAFREGFPLCRDLMDSSREETPLRGSMLRCGLEGAVPTRGGPILAIGETLGTTFPFTGEGIGKAMESGELAASVVRGALESGHPEDLSAYQGRLDRELRPRYRSYGAAQRYLSRPWLNDLVIRRAAKSASLRAAFEGIIGETADPRDVFSIRALAKSFVGK